MKNNKILYSSILLLFTVMINSCRKMDDYKTRFQGNNEISYPGILDSVKVLPGNKRVMLTGLFTSDPKIIKYRIFWNGRNDSLERSIKRSQGVDTVKEIITNLPEGAMNFEIRTFDDKGNRSVPVYANGMVYGVNYNSGIINRGITSSVFDGSKGILTINWLEADPTMLFTDIIYTSTSNQTKKIRLAELDASTVIINDYKSTTEVLYRSAFLPAKSAIDTFYVSNFDKFTK
ncbi:hypothetical protein DBR11_24745 [Pedobacter sp. HMWF019]|uniref:DUF4998 domain-containing protein n=1 Tax=Pedobacter sp. HMWF019 TaxID=2056856 RepID=UPI000D3D3B11|nr:DUF4998 domain-containing protein [Pedobacter sp. HMWF019]PTS93734.1 hypothetical protein DBR11_24745 [Pedobacter sp. HMWF019]